ncbi:hypothetical protein VTJ49DRAFT_2471 [Mycothermus thermophilus]|uniref:Zn(2)-C6 fungal-type domain-containing protein n=1 Tax=Humicola insolens TaxID=85995 RepID=A0ABR3VA09_HUMIN
MFDHAEDSPSPRSEPGPASSVSPPPAPPSVSEVTTASDAPQQSSQQPPQQQQTKKRGSVTTDGQTKATKRRAARACVSCRARKVRCDVVEGAPCGNCRWDDVECIVQESRRRNPTPLRRKNLPYNCGPSAVGRSADALRAKSISAANPMIGAAANLSKTTFGPNGAFSLPLNGVNGVDASQHLLYQQPGAGFGTPGAAAALSGFSPVTPGIPGSPGLLHSLLQTALDLTGDWPGFLKPLPDRILPEDRQYLMQKGVFSLPSLTLQNALLAAYVEFVHPYMPLLELHEFLRVLNDRSGASGKLSLFLYHAVMFAATAFVDEGLLKEAGYASRRDARRAFFSKTRLLYDFDYETDRLVLVQGLLLMTYWYETPDDQKDTWHWMGVAISLAHTIGLHRDPAKTPMIPRKQRLWKRVWWSCLMRDRLVALGMRRPTRIKSEDFDVPPLTEDDFDLEALPDDNQLLGGPTGAECALVRDVAMQRELALMCIEKARLCMLIGDMLRVQYSVLSRSGVGPDNTTKSTHMLLPNKNPENMDRVLAVDRDLRDWFAALPEACRYRPLEAASVTDANKAIAVQRNLLHMVYHTTVSALHRPLFLPASPAEGPSHPAEVQETARQRVREAADHITRMAGELRRLGLDRYLPTVGVTVILPAMIVHMLDTKSLNAETRAHAVQGLRECLVVMSNLRNIYAAADFATGFLDALLRKGMLGGQPPQQQQQPSVQQPTPAAMRPGKMINRVLAPALHLTSPGMHPMGMTTMRPSTPPPESSTATTNPFLNLRTASISSASSNHNNNNGPNGLFPPQHSPFQHHPHLNTMGTTTHHHQTLGLSNGDGELAISPAAAVNANTPPHTDSEDVATPPNSQDVEMDMDTMDVAMADDLMSGYAGMLEGSNNHGNGNTSAADAGAAAAAAAANGGSNNSGNNFDFDQWLQFPAEAGLSSTDDTFMGEVFGEHGHHGLALGGHQHLSGAGNGGVEGNGMEWLSLPEGISH